MSGIAASRYGDGFPPELRELELRVLALERTDGEGAESAIARPLDLAEVDYINVRNTEAGCFVARIDRERY